MTDAERREKAEESAHWFFADATRDAKAAYDVDMARILALTGERWRRERDMARANFYRDTIEARRLFDKSVEELLATGELSADTDAAWTALTPRKGAA